MTRPDDALPPPPISERVPLQRLDRETGRAFSVEPDEEELGALARYLSVESLDNLRFDGRIEPFEADGWRVEGRIVATVRQSCVVTLEPVLTNFALAVARTFLPNAIPSTAFTFTPDAPETERDPPEPLGDAIDLGQILVEDLALAIDPYPRLAGVELGELRHAAPGVAPLEPEELRPFASLSALRDKLARGGH